jgi:dihydroorotate dehydrogenase subfamily 1
MSRNGKRISFLGRELRGRFGFPSGVIATNDDTARWMLEHIPQLGFFVGKSTTIAPREGYPEDILSQPAPDALWNAVGYANPGLEEMVESFRALREAAPPGVMLITQIGEGGEEAFAHCVDAFERAGHVDAFEINLSCPHIEKGGILIGGDPDIVRSIVAVCRQRTRRPLIVKLNAGVDRLEAVAAAAEAAGADALSAINTIGGPNPELSHGFGGLSGPRIFPVAVQAIRRIRTASRLPLILMGGVRGAADVRTLDGIAPGSLVAIGSALAGFDSEAIREYFALLERDLAEGTDQAAEQTLHELLMEYRPFVVSEVVEHSPSLRTLRFHQDLEAGIGQFVFLKLGPDLAKPFSVAGTGRGLELVVRKVGRMTAKAFELKPNDVVRIRGPYGHSFAFPPDRKVIFVGAGCGIAPVHHAASHHPGPKRFVLGAVTSADLTYLDELRGMGEVAVATDDGSLGFQGFVSELLAKVLEQEGAGGALFFNCGPEVAMQAVDAVARRYVPPGDIHHLVERVTSCGIGICGKCTTPSGERICVDGPVFTAAGFTLGLYTRDKTGKKVGDPSAFTGKSCAVGTRAEGAGMP